MSGNLKGYNGKIAYVNLSEEKVEIKDLDPQIARDYLGGTGLSAKIIHDLLSADDYKTLMNDSFSEINPVIFATGPVTGTLRTSSGRYSVSGISPLTGIWGEGTSGGYFCISLRNSGFDAIVMTGKAKKPTYLYVHDGSIEFKDAAKIWGNDCYQSQKLIKEELNNERVRVSTIGLGGENLVKYGCLISDEGRAVGRCGLGALMGSKKVKALAIAGGKKVELANSELARELRKEQDNTKPKAMTDILQPTLFRLYGTNGYMDLGMINGDTPGFYFSKSEFFADKLVMPTLKEEYPIFNYSCAGCTAECGKMTIIEHEGKEIEVDGPEYESVASFGSLCGVFDSKPVILSNHMSNVYGVDTISCGVSIAFLLYLVENNLGIEKIKQHLKDIKIEEIKWGNGDLVLKLIEKIAKRDGIGDILANGTRAMAKILEVDPELAAHVKGLEIPMHDPRAFIGQALSYMTGCTGANHNKCDWYSAQMGNARYPKIRIRPGKTAQDIRGKERAVANLQDLRAIDDSAVNCNFSNIPLKYIVGYINASTGFNYDVKSLMKVGERINNLKRLINCTLGITREDDKLPGHLTKVFTEGKTTGVKLDLEKHLKKYYTSRGWDWDTGHPTEEKLKELGLN